jgi:hypothetical protein
MNDAQDDYSLIPSPFDLERLNALLPDGRVESENKTWIVLRYPAKADNPEWHEFTLCVNCPKLQAPHPFELKKVEDLLELLGKLEGRRKGRKGS